MKVHSTKKGTVTRVTLQGELVVEEVAIFRQDLLMIMQHAHKIVLDLSKVTCLHFSYLQLLCAAHRHACKSNKTLSLSLGPDAQISRFIRLAGYETKAGCSETFGQSCLWRIR